MFYNCWTTCKARNTELQMKFTNDVYTEKIKENELTDVLLLEKPYEDGIGDPNLVTSDDTDILPQDPVQCFVSLDGVIEHMENSKVAEWLSPLLRGVMLLLLQILCGGQLRFSLISGPVTSRCWSQFISYLLIP